MEVNASGVQAFSGFNTQIRSPGAGAVEQTQDDQQQRTTAANQTEQDQSQGNGSGFATQDRGNNLNITV